MCTLCCLCLDAAVVCCTFGPMSTSRTTRPDKKSRTRSKPAPSEAGSSPSTSTTLTARFTTEERELVERAAELRKWSAGQLVRDAAVRRAADIINSSQRNRTRLERLAAHFRTRLLNPALESEYADMSAQAQRLRAEIEFAEKSGDGDYDPSYDEYANANALTTRVTPLHQDDLDQLLTALRTCPTEFAVILAEQLSLKEEAASSDVYEPIVVPPAPSGGEDQ